MGTYKKIALTGGTGFLGKKLHQWLKEKKYEVVLIGREEFSSNDRLRTSLVGVDAVIHSAGLVSYKKSDHKRMHQSNVELTEKILNIAKYVGVKKFIHVSSIVTLGFSEQIRNESSEFNAANLNLDYWNTKYKSEQIALQMNGADFAVVVANPGTFLGIGERSGELCALVQSLSKKCIAIVPNGGSDFVSVDDVVQGVWLCLEKGKPGNKYIIGSENLSYAQLYARVRKLKKLNARVLVVPRWVLNFIERCLYFFENKLGTQIKLSSAKLRRINGVFMLHDLTKAKNELGYHPHSVDKALLEMLE